MAKKALGWILIIAGLLIMFYAICSTYLNFSGQNEFPLIFDLPEEANVNPVINEEDNGNSEDIINQSIQNLIPKGTDIGGIAEQGLNMLAWILFAFFMVYAGGKLIVVGNNLLKTSEKQN
ncbi:MAG: hypothetical protein PWQ56_54 [Patescibacteria group bacterium]|nr:hypothetical protein [Patescibacteria group bacterium]